MNFYDSHTPALLSAYRTVYAAQYNGETKLLLLSEKQMLLIQNVPKTVEFVSTSDKEIQCRLVISYQSQNQARECKRYPLSYPLQS